MDKVCCIRVSKVAGKILNLQVADTISFSRHLHLLVVGERGARA